MLKLIKNFEKRDYILIILTILLIVVQVWLDLKMPDYMSEITMLVKTEGSKMSDILYNGGFMLLCSLGSLVSTIISGYFLALLASGFSSKLREKIFYKVQNLSLDKIKHFETSSLITRTTNDISQVEMLIGMGLQLLIKAPITAVWAICKIVNKSFSWTLATSICVLIMLSVVTILTIVVIPKFKIVQKLIDKLNKIARENITGIRVIRAFNAEKYTKNKYEDVNDKLTKQQLFNQKAFAVMSPMMYLIMNMLALVIYIIGSNLILNAGLADKITLFGDMIVFSSYSMQIIMSFLMLAMIFTVLPRSEVSANRINEVLCEKSSIINGTFDGKTDTKGTVEFCNVSFKYPDAKEYILENISFKAEKGETVAFIGSTGSGKSTLINLVPRFYDATSGEILVDGINVKEYKLEKLYDKLGYVSQKAVIFNGSVNYNVEFGENGKKKNVKKAIEIAQAKEFVENMDDKYESNLSQGGTNISGGQKQRISIARAIARDPEIYIFDDSFSALDYKTDLNLRKAIKKNVKDATCLIVAQRMGTIMHADKIIVLDKGKCVGMGTHKELLESCEVYKEIALSQISKEELEHA